MLHTAFSSRVGWELHRAASGPWQPCWPELQWQQESQVCSWPDQALSDGPNMWPLDNLEELLMVLVELDRIVKRGRFVESVIDELLKG